MVVCIVVEVPLLFFGGGREGCGPLRRKSGLPCSGRSETGRRETDWSHSLDANPLVGDDVVGVVRWVGGEDVEAEEGE